MSFPSIRVAVTGSRGKSGVVRLLHGAFRACGLRCRARITGVVPRELGPEGERPVLRPSGAHVREMKWWLSQLSEDTQAVVLENSAVAPELQCLCARWLDPTVSVLTNIRPDHEAQWGPGEARVLRALSRALPAGGAVVLPEDLARRTMVKALALERNWRLVPAHPVPGLPPYLSVNTGLALAVCEYHQLDLELCRQAMAALKPDVADFGVLSLGAGRLAFAFSANDVATTEELFQSLEWPREETTALFNHRSDRADRLRSFGDWLLGQPWRNVIIIGDKPPRGAFRDCYVPVGTVEALARLIEEWGSTLGCGNTVYGLPLRLKLALEEGRLGR